MEQLGVFYQALQIHSKSIICCRDGMMYGPWIKTPIGFSVCEDHAN